MNAPPDNVLEAVGTLSRPACGYIYDLDVLTQRATALRNVLPRHSQIYYAMKANGHPKVLSRAVQQCDGIEVASGGELRQARQAGAPRLVFSGPAKTDAALRSAIEGDDVTINVESLHELRRIDHFSRQYDTVTDVALRVNRAVYVPDGSHQMTGMPTPFGIAETQIDEVIAWSRRLTSVRLTGIHLHAISNNIDALAHAAFIDAGLQFAADLSQRHDLQWETVNIGGGIGADPAGRGEFDLEAFAHHLPTWPADSTVLLEPGRFLVADAGWYASEVIDIKHTFGRTFAVIRGGTHHFRLPAAWGYDHGAQVYPVHEWDYPWPRTEVRDCAVDLAGELCTPRDVLCRDLAVNRLRIGDIVILGRTGAYGWDSAHHDFLQHPYPEVIILST